MVMVNVDFSQQDLGPLDPHGNPFKQNKVGSDRVGVTSEPSDETRKANRSAAMCWRLEKHGCSFAVRSSSKCPANDFESFSFGFALRLEPSKLKLLEFVGQPHVLFLIFFCQGIRFNVDLQIPFMDHLELHLKLFISQNQEQRCCEKSTVEACHECCTFGWVGIVWFWKRRTLSSWGVQRNFDGIEGEPSSDTCRRTCVRMCYKGPEKNGLL